MPLKVHVKQVPLKILENIRKKIPLQASTRENVHNDIFCGTSIVIFSVTENSDKLTTCLVEARFNYSHVRFQSSSSGPK